MFADLRLASRRSAGGAEVRDLRGRGPVLMASLFARPETVSGAVTASPVSG
ncbi:hypothetical protein [Nonomuraea sp. SYSU D8015]|uniref:hypothetical protein n=1 Tax=Nonomuraea sp. SYSU D8015 TaxID=2593644 RepID=UPI001660297C|nr:hypothetical protein [Nonomuraea sp. SYSU D8015]